MSMEREALTEGVSEQARALVYPVAAATRHLDSLIMRRAFGRPSPDNQAGRLAVEAVHALERTECALRTMYAFDPTGL